MAADAKGKRTRQNAGCRQVNVMWQWLCSNPGTIMVLLALAALIGFAIAGTKKSGCNGDCAHCHGSCGRDHK